MIKHVLRQRTFFKFNKHINNQVKNQQQTQKHHQPGNRDFGKSFDSFVTQYQLDIKDQIQSKRIPSPPQDKILMQSLPNQTEYNQQNLEQLKLLQQNNFLKVKEQSKTLRDRLLTGRCETVAGTQKSFFEKLGRPETIFYQNRVMELNLKKEKELTELSELLKGEEHIDYSLVNQDWQNSVDEAQDYGNNRLEKSYRESQGLYEKQDKHKAGSIKQWRQWNQTFEPIEKQHIEQFPLQTYPGSEKGPNPQDDVENYMSWFERTYPKDVVDSFQAMASSLRDDPPSVNRDLDYRPTQTYTTASEALQPTTNEGLILAQPEDSFMEQTAALSLSSHQKEGEADLLPDYLPFNHEDLIECIMKWSRFRVIGKISKVKELMDKLMEKEDPSVNDESMGREDQFKLTSLYPYYCTLPKFMRDHTAVKTAYKALEFTKHTLSIEEKERALNFVCQQCLELDDLSKQVFSHLAETRRFYPTIEDEKVFVHDIDKHMVDAYLNPEEAEKYQNSKPLYPDMHPPEGEWQYPYPKRFETEDGDPTPVDYFDNDDGYWDNYIKTKLEYYVNNKRISTSRPFFKH